MKIIVSLFVHFPVWGLLLKFPSIAVGFMLMQSAGSADIVVGHADTLTLAR